MSVLDIAGCSMLRQPKVLGLSGPLKSPPPSKLPFNNIITTSACMHAQSLQSCLTLCDPIDWSLPGSSVHVILQARILKWVAIPSFRGSSWPNKIVTLNWTYCPCLRKCRRMEKIRVPIHLWSQHLQRWNEEKAFFSRVLPPIRHLSVLSLPRLTPSAFSFFFSFLDNVAGNGQGLGKHILEYLQPPPWSGSEGKSKASSQISREACLNHHPLNTQTDRWTHMHANTFPPPMPASAAA